MNILAHVSVRIGIRVHVVCAHVVAFTGISPLPEALMKVGQGQVAISVLPRFLLLS